MQHLTIAAVVLAVMPLAACSMSVDKDEHGDRANVDIRTPLGAVSVHTNDTASTGLSVYPGARSLHDGDEPATANVNVGGSFFGVKVVAAKFETDALPDAILDYYRKEMRTFGDVVECRGNVNFKGRDKHPVCSNKLFSDERQLVSGVEEQHRVVSVKRRGSGSEFSLVYVQTRGES